MSSGDVPGTDRVSTPQIVVALDFSSWGRLGIKDDFALLALFVREPESFGFDPLHATTTIVDLNEHIRELRLEVLA